MLTSFFSKSKPIHFVIVGLYMIFFYCLSNFFYSDQDLDIFYFSKKILGLIALLLSMFLLNFTANKNDLTKNNTFKIILFAAFTALFPETLQNNDIIFANLFIVLAFRRTVSLRTLLSRKEKIFDAIFWISVASLFSFWAIVFAVIVLVALIIYNTDNFKNWLIPIIAFLSVGLLATCFHLLVYDEFYTWEEWSQQPNLDFTKYGETEILIPLSFILAFTLWSGTYFFGSFQRVPAVVRSSFILVLFLLIASIVVAIFAPTKNSSELLFFLVPLSIIAANYFDRARDKWFKEALLIILIVLPFVLPLF